MSALYDALLGPSPALWLETSPPRGIATESLLAKLGAMRGKVAAVNLVDNALGRVKLSGLVFASMIKARLDMPVVLNVSCRDRNRFALTSDLLGAGAVGIDGVVALQGDKLPEDGSAGAKPVRDLDTFALLRLIADLNRGDTGEGRRLLKTLPGLLPGAVGNPNRKAIDRELELLERKAAAGARFVITQPVFEAATARPFIEKANACGLKVILGILPIKRESMANYLKDRIADLSGAGQHLDRYAGMSEEEARRMSIEENIKLMSALAGEVAGFNIMSGGGPSLAIELANEWNRSQSTAGR
jgi:methionine synthase / methylenetetrahydrofolate reductase(NADPH)